MALQEDSDSICSQSPLHKRSQIKGSFAPTRLSPSLVYQQIIHRSREDARRAKEAKRRKQEGEYKFLAENEFEVSLTSAEMNFCLDVAVVPDNDHPFLTSNNDPILSSTSTKDPNLTSIIDKTLVSEYAENGMESEGGLCLGLGTSPSRFVRLEMGNEFLVSSPRGLGSTEDSFSTIEQNDEYKNLDLQTKKRKICLFPISTDRAKEGRKYKKPCDDDSLVPGSDQDFVDEGSHQDYEREEYSKLSDGDLNAKLAEEEEEDDLLLQLEDNSLAVESIVVIAKVGDEVPGFEGTATGAHLSDTISLFLSDQKSQGNAEDQLDATEQHEHTVPNSQELFIPLLLGPSSSNFQNQPPANLNPGEEENSGGEEEAEVEAGEVVLDAASQSTNEEGYSSYYRRGRQDGDLDSEGEPSEPVFVYSEGEPSEPVIVYSEGTSSELDLDTWVPVFNPLRYSDPEE